MGQPDTPKPTHAVALRVDIDDLKSVVSELRQDRQTVAARLIEMAIDDLMELRISSDAGVAVTQDLNQRLDDMRARLQSAEDALVCAKNDLASWQDGCSKITEHFARYGGSYAESKIEGGGRE